MTAARDPAPLNDMLSLEGNRAVYERLQQRLDEGSATAFIGAGASFPLYPLWGRLIDELAAEPVRRGLAKEADRKYWLKNAEHKPVQMAAQIHNSLGDNYYHTFLYETFKDRGGDDGRMYTPTHAALVRAGFKALITTNYDPGVLEARRVLRPDIRETGFAVWNQSFAVNHWATGDVFDDGPACPVLFAHGHFSDPANIVLDAPSYRRAYHDTPYRRLFENLWFQHHLVFVGFSFNDVVLTQIADEVLWETTRQEGGPPRHIAVIGLPIDQQYSPEMRREYLAGYDAEVLFYPVGRTPDGHPDHSALGLLLESLVRSDLPASEVTDLAAPSEAETPPDKLQVGVKARFVHETTDDEKFTGRNNPLDRLDDWAADDTVRLIAVTGVGGLGKTALIGHWLKTGRAAQGRSADGLFFWSFYRDREVSNFVSALLKFARSDLNWKPRRRRTLPRDQVIELLAARRIVAVLDGLEVIQEAPGTVAYGKLLEPELAQLLHEHGRSGAGSLMVLTSRFPFPDLTPHLGGALRLLSLASLEHSDGAALLASLGVAGEIADREEISRRLDGHPLALRIFARSMPADVGADPTRLWELIFVQPNLEDDDSLEGKMVRLLKFYEDRLPQAHRRALGLVGLFRAPIGESTLAALWDQLKADAAASLPALRGVLNELQREHLLTADPAPDGSPRYACHPILRDHFRAGMLADSDWARQAADLLADRPAAGEARSLESVQIIATAIDLLLQAEELEAANDLYLTRLENGRIFMRLPAPQWGIETVRGFLRHAGRRKELKEILGLRRLSYYLNEMGLFNTLAGEPSAALEYYSETETIERARKNHSELAIRLRNLSVTKATLGLLSDAVACVVEALQLVTGTDDEQALVRTSTFLGHFLSLRGDVSVANRHFKQASDIRIRDPDADGQYSFGSILWAEHLLRVKKIKCALTVTESNIEICQREGWQDSVARCDWVFGWAAIQEQRWDQGEQCLAKARATFTKGHMIYELARVYVTEAACLFGQERRDAALTACERALELAAPRNYRLVHADALNQRARILLSGDQADPTRARDDAEAALHLAEWCEYAWGQRDALELLADAYRRLGDREQAASYQTRADDWNRRLQP